VPVEAARRWLPRQQQIALVELLAPVAAIHLWPHLLETACCLVARQLARHGGLGQGLQWQAGYHVVGRHFLD
jgi:hypothetical protein